MPPEIELLRASPVRVEFGRGKLARLGAVCVEEGGTRVLVVTDPGLVRAGHAERAALAVREAGVEVTVFQGIEEDPTTEHVEAGARAARELGVNLIVGLGGGSAMDCAKGVNLVVSLGGEVADSWGDPPMEELRGRAPLLPMVLVPTTAGTGSEAQSFALIADRVTRQKMACGDRRAPREGGLRPRAAILDPELLATVPRGVAAMAGIDAIAHAVETAGCRVRTEFSRGLSRAAWGLLDGAFERVMGAGDSSAEIEAARAEMLVGAHLAGAAIEASMLGAAHACANPLTARHGVPHGAAVGLMLPHVIRFNAGAGENPYSDLSVDAEWLARRVEELMGVAGLARRLGDWGVGAGEIGGLAEEAGRQWTAGFNWRGVGASDLAEFYKAAAK